MLNVENWWVALGTAVLASLTAQTILRIVFRKPRGPVRLRIEYESHSEVPVKRPVRRAAERPARRALRPPRGDA
jgi:hypothetical protein